jgi:hypothetical protein
VPAKKRKTMNTQVATLASVQDKVRERIQASFMDLIPHELWDGMVDAELKRFTREDLPKLVVEQAKLKALEMLKLELAKPAWADRWGMNGMDPSPMVSEVVRQCAPELVAALFGGLVQQLVQHARNGGVRGF